MTGLLHASWVDALVSVVVVANLLPILPVVLTVVSDVPRRRRRRTMLLALLVGNAGALAFAFLGGAVLSATGSGLDDLRVAGGVILLVFAVYDLLFSREERKEALSEMLEDEDGGPEIGLVPLGMPIMVGPATLAAVLLVAEAYGYATMLLVVLVNGVVNAALLFFAVRVMDVLGHGTVRTAGKVFGLLLATLAVAMVRTGISNMVAAG